MLVRCARWQFPSATTTSWRCTVAVGLRRRDNCCRHGRFQNYSDRVGRTWTASNVKKDRFAIPEIRDRSQRAASSDNPFNVLDPADLVIGGMADNCGSVACHFPIGFSSDATSTKSKWSQSHGGRP